MRLWAGRRGGVSVSTKIAFGFFVVLVLHVSIAVTGHFGLEKAKQDLATADELSNQVEAVEEIERAVGELQRNVLLYAHVGTDAPGMRVVEWQDAIDKMLDDATNLVQNEDSNEHLGKMKANIASHREMFVAVVRDRNKRKSLVRDELRTIGDEFDVVIEELKAVDAVRDQGVALDASFLAARYHAKRFVIDPDSSHVRQAKEHLAESAAVLQPLLQSTDPEVALAATKVSDVMARYERAFIQMFQTTRSYLHLVNVVLAGEFAEFRRSAKLLRLSQRSRADRLCRDMAKDHSTFQMASNTFSLLTIVLGLLAAWWIGRDVAPPLNAITKAVERLSKGSLEENIPGLERKDELGSLAAAAQIFKEKSAETERALAEANAAKAELSEVNARLEEKKALAEKMMVDANAATAAKSEFLANMSHEIRTPMTAILGFAETLSGSVQGTEERDAIRTIQRNGEHLLSIINDILDLSKVESGKMSVEVRDVDVCALVKEVISLVQVKADGVGIKLEVSYDGPIPRTIQSDETRLKQILVNLLGNAIKFTEHGVVRLHASVVGDASDAKVQFDIIDSGIGMGAEQIEALFQPFSQADNSVTRRFGGTGLGLTISRRFAIMLGGDIELVDSVVGKGSHFRAVVAAGDLATVDFVPNPLHESTKPTPKPQPSSELALKGKRVLLVEDGPDNRKLISFFLKKAGASVQIAEDGQQGVQAVEQAEQQSLSFDCILMDMQMPVMDGYSAVQYLRSKGYQRPIVALTAHAMDSDRAKCLDAGCDDYSTKPIDRIKLLGILAHWCASDGQTANAAAPDVSVS